MLANMAVEFFFSSKRIGMEERLRVASKRRMVSMG